MLGGVARRMRVLVLTCGHRMSGKLLGLLGEDGGGGLVGHHAGPLLPGRGGQVADRARAPQPIGRGRAALSPPLHWGGEGAGRGAQRWREWDTRRRVMRAEVVEVWEGREWTSLALGVMDTATGQQ